MLAGCASPQAPAGQSSANQQPSTSAPKRLVAAVNSEPVVLDQRVSATSVTPPGTNVLDYLVNAGLANQDDAAVLQAKLAETMPTVDNGLWKVFPDGRMQVTWKLRPGLQWQDGSPLTAADVLFGAKLGADTELAVFHLPAYDFVAGVQSPDPNTVVVDWTRPFIDADAMFVKVLPAHLLEQSYSSDKMSFTQLPFWSEGFVGAGPFRVQQWDRGAQVILRAFDRYVFGRPKIDELVVKFIQDPNTLMANVLAGDIDMTLAKSLTLEQGLQVRQQWQGGHVDVGPANWLVLFPQFVNPDPAIIGNVQFRRAVLHSLNRQEMVDTLMGGQTVVAHSFLNPNQPQYKDIEAQITRYDYDPRQAAQLIEGLGYSKGPDGAYRDASSQKLVVEARSVSTVELNQKVILAMADYLQRIGVGVDPNVFPQQRLREQDWIAQFPGFLMYRNPNDLAGLGGLYGSRASLAENNFRVTGNNSRYMNPEFDALLDRYFSTVPLPARIQALGAVIKHISEQLNVMGLFYDQQPTMIASRVLNVTVTRAVNEPQAASAHLWDVQG
jgi:peptide/nickel transport system substrate-binding protein